MEKLFNEIKKSASDAFRNLKKNENHDLIKKSISHAEKLWQDYKPYADKDFPIQFQIDHESRYWEMYLTCTLLYKSLPVKSMFNRSVKGPDILIENNNNHIWVEAIAPTCGEFSNLDRVDDFELGKVLNIPDKKIILRFTGAIKEKFEKHKKYIIEGVVLPSDSYIIAINSCKINTAQCEFEIPRIIRAVLPIGYPICKFDKEGGKIIKKGYEYKPVVNRKSGEGIGTDFFLNPEYENISGIIYSSVRITSIADRKHFGVDVNYGEDLMFIHNPMAKNPIPEGFFKFGTEVKIDNDKCLINFKYWDRPFFKEYKNGDVTISTNIPMNLPPVPT